MITNFIGGVVTAGAAVPTRLGPCCCGASFTLVQMLLNLGEVKDQEGNDQRCPVFSNVDKVNKLRKLVTESKVV